MITKDVLLIIHDVYQDFNHFPLGAGYIASVLEKSNISVEAYCMDVFHFSNQDLSEKLKKNSYHLICVGYLAARFKETILDLCRTINSYKKGAWLVLGGPGPSPIPEYTLKATGADIVVIGDAEETIVELANEKKKNLYSLGSVKGIAYREDNNIKVNERRSPIKNLDSIPFPAWHLFPMEQYISNYKAPYMDDKDRNLSLVTSRGCVNECSFCYRMEKGIRLRSLSNIAEEIKLTINKFGITHFFIVDELFIVSEKRMLDFEKMINGLDFIYTAEARADMFNENIAWSLKRSGCRWVNIGFESSSQEVLNEINKNVTVEQNMRALEICEKAGLGVGLNFIWGFSRDTRETLMDNVRLIKKYNKYHQLRTIRPVTPYPGSKIYYDAIKKGMLNGPEDFFNKFLNSDLITVNFTPFPLEDCYKWLFEANKELIYDHFIHTKGSMDEAEDLISQFKDLYCGKNISFRGARKYSKNNK